MRAAFSRSPGKTKPDVIIALGGGSVIDEAKFVGVGYMYDGDPWDLAVGAAPITGITARHRSRHDPRHQLRAQQRLRHVERGAPAEGRLRQPGHAPQGRNPRPRADLHDPPAPDRLLRGRHHLAPARSVLRAQRRLGAVPGSLLPGEHPHHHGVHGPPAGGSRGQRSACADDVDRLVGMERVLSERARPLRHDDPRPRPLAEQLLRHAARRVHVRHDPRHHALLPGHQDQEVRRVRPRGVQGQPRPTTGPRPKRASLRSRRGSGRSARLSRWPKPAFRTTASRRWRPTP